MSKLAAIRGVSHLEPRFQGEGVVPGEYFLVSTKLDTFSYPTVQTIPCNSRRFDTIPACDGRIDRQTDGIAIASTALAMRALQRALKNDIYCFDLTTCKPTGLYKK